jgi:pre-mRNA-splicing factor SYF1
MWLLALLQAPPEESKPLFLQYANLEEQYGLARSAMEVYEKAVRTVPEAERMAVYDLYLARAHEFFGLGKVRSLA